MGQVGCNLDHTCFFIRKKAESFIEFSHILYGNEGNFFDFVKDNSRRGWTFSSPFHRSWTFFMLVKWRKSGETWRKSDKNT